MAALLAWRGVAARIDVINEKRDSHEREITPSLIFVSDEPWHFIDQLSDSAHDLGGRQ